MLVELACREDWKIQGRNALKEVEIDKYLESNEALFNWTWRFHDKINKYLGKTSSDYQKTKNWYFKHLSSDYTESENCKSCSV